MQQEPCLECKDFRFYMDGILRQNLDTIKKTITRNWDFLWVIDGIERGGKSSLAQQLALYLDPTFNIDRVCFTPEEFRLAVSSAQKYQAVVYDEAHFGLNSRQAMSQTNRAIVSMLTEIGKKNLFIFVLLPTFFDLDKYVALWRSVGLIHVEVKDNYERGYFKYYNRTSKKFLYVQGKKYYDYKCAKPNFWGKFPKGYAVNEAEYEAKKDKGMLKYTPQGQATQALSEFRKGFVERLYSDRIKKKLNQNDIAHLIEVCDSSIKNYIREKRLQNEQYEEDLHKNIDIPLE